MNDEEKPYRGPERRWETRRGQKDRRQEIRFEPEKEERRKNAGRRQSDKDGNLWRFNP